MSKTLFWYIFWDLLKVFALASAALAGIMSFGGLLRPLTRQGLGLAEVAVMVVNLMPAMSTYSLPVAALFATTLVYGRLSSENELTAVRAGGISHLQAAYPGIVLGFVVAGISLYMLFLVVPASTLRVEKVIYSNFARLMATSIERTHEFRLGDRNGPTLSAQGARIVPPDTNDPDRQTVVLDSPLIILSDVVRRPDGPIRVPREFYTAKRATVHIRPAADSDDVEVIAQLEDGISFPRRFQGATTGGVRATQFGPMLVPSTIAEKTKFMDLRRLKAIYTDPDSSKPVRDVVRQSNTLQQQRAVLDALEAQLRQASEAYFEPAPPPGSSPGTGTGTGTSPAPASDAASERHSLNAPPGFILVRGGDREIVLSVPEAPASARTPGIRFETSRAAATTLVIEARRVSVRPAPSTSAGLVQFELLFQDALVRAGGPNEEPSARDSFRRSFSVRMTPAMLAIGNRDAAQQRLDSSLPADLRARLDRQLIVLRNEVLGELNARAAFAVSCLVLVLMGVSLGMMLRSGHFLSAFALTVGPALLCILLTTTGQHTLESIPGVLPPNWNNPFTLGIVMIWSGNVVVLIVSSFLLYRLQKQ